MRAQTETAEPFGSQIFPDKPLQLAVRQILKELQNQHPKGAFCTQLGPPAVRLKRFERSRQRTEIYNRFETTIRMIPRDHPKWKTSQPDCDPSKPLNCFKDRKSDISSHDP